MEHASIYIQDGAATQNDLATGTLWTRVTAFDTRGPFNRIQPNAGNDTLEILKGSIYFAFTAIDFIASESTRIEFSILKNDQPTAIRAGHSTGVSGTYDTLSFAGDLRYVPGDDISLGVQSEITGSFITVKNATLGAFRLDNQG